MVEPLVLQPGDWIRLGPQGPLLRFLAGFIALTLAKRAMDRFPYQWYFAAGINLVLTGAAFLISPEIGVAFIDLIQSDRELLEAIAVKALHAGP